MPGSEKPASNPVAISLVGSPLRTGSAPALHRWHKPAFIVFVLVWLVHWALLVLRIDLPLEGRWVETLLPAAAAVTTLAGLARRLPLQNVFTAATLVGLVACGITAVGAFTGIPFGPIFYTDVMGEPFPAQVPWTVPVLWMVLIVNGRGVARLIMRPWRKTNYYGFWVIGLTCLLVVLFDLCFEPFAVHVKGYWLWLNPKTALTWYTAPLANFLGWFISVLGIVVFSIPWLINKHPVKQPTDYHPLILWLMLSSWVLTGMIREQLWLAVGLSVVANGIATVYAVRGARW